jgi:hypothetical protein
MQIDGDALRCARPAQSHAPRPSDVFRRAILARGRSQRPRRESRAGSRPTFHHPVCKGREACPHVSVGRLLIATASARRHSGSKPEYPCYRTMTYSKGAPGEVMLDGTVSDPVACPSMLLYRLDEPPFGARSARRAARARATSRTAVRLSRVVVNESFGCALHLRAAALEPGDGGRAADVLRRARGPGAGGGDRHRP